MRWGQRGQCKEHQDLLVKAADTSITGPDTLKGKKLRPVKGSTPAAKLHDKYPDVQLQEYDTYSKCVEALVGGAIDAVTTDNAMIDLGHWQSAVDANFGPAGFAVDKTTNPPKPDSCG